MAKRFEEGGIFVGRWVIASMSQFDLEYVNAEEEGYFEFRESGSGDFQFGYVSGQMNCRTKLVARKLRVEWTWEGRDEMDDVSGCGWAVLKGEKLHGEVIFHGGDETDFVAKRA